VNSDEANKCESVKADESVNLLGTGNQFEPENCGDDENRGDTVNFLAASNCLDRMNFPDRHHRSGEHTDRRCETNLGLTLVTGVCSGKPVQSCRPS
jgi:hypothetical protein